MQLINLNNEKFGKLLVIDRVGTQGKHPLWKCICDCGNETVVRGDHLREGKTQSCGCFEKENRKNGANYKHGGRYSRLYSIWSGMIKRCFNQKCAAYINYGYRGIRVTKEWLKLLFLETGHLIMVMQINYRLIALIITEIMSLIIVDGQHQKSKQIIEENAHFSWRAPEWKRQI